MVPVRTDQLMTNDLSTLPDHSAVPHDAKALAFHISSLAATFDCLTGPIPPRLVRECHSCLNQAIYILGPDPRFASTQYYIYRWLEEATERSSWFPANDSNRRVVDCFKKAEKLIVEVLNQSCCPPQASL